MVCQKYILKIHSSRLRKENWDLTLPLDEARNNDELVSLADSQILRWIDELNGIEDADLQAKEIKRRIRVIKKEPSSVQNKKAIRKLYTELDAIQYKPDYMCLVIDKEKDYYRACEGFSINGITYKRLLGTNGGIKNSTVVFVSERLHPELNRRIENGRDQNKELVTAKLEAYKALTCSASVPVSMPHGVLIVEDAETEFTSDIIYLTDECPGEPVMEERKGEFITQDASDGFGMMLPALAERWSEELGLDYTVSGVNTRCAFEKGMVFTFDYVDFAENIAGSYIVKDAWGDDVDVRDVELVMTTSMVKLWDSYESCEDYLSKAVSNGYTFGISKTCPKELENERNLNYQFIQSYDLSDDDIDRLIKPTMDEINDVLTGDWRKTVLFLKGLSLNENSVRRLPDDYIKALMIDRRMMSDPYVKSNIYHLIRNRINEAKVGVLKVHGNYSVVSGDPFLLCQSMFGLKKTGLLGQGEVYNKYWADCGADRLVCFRAPMTCHNNIRLVHPTDNDDVRYWYRYMSTVTVFNGWDTAASALNGCDFDGDIVMLTDNDVLLERLTPLPALMCAQRRAEKRVPIEEDFIRSNIDSFGNEIGQTTNYITSMFEVRAGFDPGSEEFEMLSYRIRCGQLYQQNAIDKAKGIVCKPMPKEWHDRHAVAKIEDEDKRDFYRRIIADRKPYFMRYIYPALMKEYNNYVKRTDKSALREFGMTVSELKALPIEGLTDRQKEFIHYYEYMMPVGINDCVMNKICRRFEDAFDGRAWAKDDGRRFDYTFMKNSSDYTAYRYDEIKKLYTIFNKRLKRFVVYAKTERVDEYEYFNMVESMRESFERECAIVCQDSMSLCNILLDICYTKNATKQFVWKMCGEEIIRSLLEKNGMRISYPERDDFGDVEYGGKRFSIREIYIGEVMTDDCSE